MGRRRKKKKKKQQSESTQHDADDQTNSTVVEDLDDPFPGLDRPPSAAELRALERLRVLVMDRVGRNKLVLYNDVRFDWREQLGGSVSAIFGAKPRRRVYALMQASSAWLVRKGRTPDRRWPLAGMVVGYVEHELFGALRVGRAVMVQRVLDSFGVDAIEDVRGVDDARPVDVVLRTQDAASLEVLVRAGLKCASVQVTDRLEEWWYNDYNKPTCSVARELLRSHVHDGGSSAKAMLRVLLQSPQGKTVIEAFSGVYKDFFKFSFKDEVVAWKGLDSSLAGVLAMVHEHNPVLLESVPPRRWFQTLLGRKLPLPLTVKELMQCYTLEDSLIVSTLTRLTASVSSPLRDQARHGAMCELFQSLLDELLQRDPGCMKRHGSELLAGVVYSTDGNALHPPALQRKLVRLLLDAGASVLDKSCFPHGSSILHASACRPGFQAMVKLLRKSLGAEEWKHLLFSADNYGALVIHVAADPDVVRLLLREGIDVNAHAMDGSQRTPLHLACTRLAHDKSKSVVYQLLSRGADAQAVDARGRTPLWMAAKTGSAAAASVVALLVEHGADPRFPNPSNGCTSLHVACGSGAMDAERLSLMRALLRLGADVNAADHKGLLPLHYLLQPTTTPLKLRAVEILLGEGVDVTVVDQRGRTFLSHVVSTGRKRAWEDSAEHIRVLELLLEAAGDNAQRLLDAVDAEGQSLLHDAARFRCASHMCWKLRELGCRPDALNLYDELPLSLHLALHGADVDVHAFTQDLPPTLLTMADHDGQTPVHLALDFDLDDPSVGYRLVDAFLSLGLDPNATATPDGLPLLLFVLEAAIESPSRGMSRGLERLGRHLLRLGANPTSPYPGTGVDMYPSLQDYVNECNLWLSPKLRNGSRPFVKRVREHYMRYFGAQVCTFLCPLHEALRRRRAPDTPLARFASSLLFDLNTLSMVLGFMSVREHTVDRRWRASRRDQVRAHEETRARRQRAAQEEMAAFDAMEGEQDDDTFERYG